MLASPARPTPQTGPACRRHCWRSTTHRRLRGSSSPGYSRLARALTVQEAALAIAWQAGGRVFTADTGEVLRDDPDDPMRTALRQVVGGVAELDRRMVVKRLRDGRAAKASTGRKVTGCVSVRLHRCGQRSRPGRNAPRR